MSLFSEQVKVRVRSIVGRDDYGNDVYDHLELPEPLPAWWEPRTSGEDTNAREQITSGYWLFLEPDSTLDASAQVQLGGVGDWWEVDGEPGEQPGGFELEGYVQVALTKVSG